jgi:prevent-host-death family protein
MIMEQVSIRYAKTNLARLLDEVAGGEEIVITKGGKPVVKLVPIAAGARMRKPGFLKSKIRIADDFDAPLSTELRARES